MLFSLEGGVMIFKLNSLIVITYLNMHMGGLHDGGFHVLLLMLGHGHLSLIRVHLARTCAWSVVYYVGGT